MGCFQLGGVVVLAAVSLVLVESLCWWRAWILGSQDWKWLHVLFEFAWLGFWHGCDYACLGYALLLVVEAYFLSCLLVVWIPLGLAVCFLCLFLQREGAGCSLRWLLCPSCALLVPFEWLLDPWERMLVFLQFVHLLLGKTNWLGHNE